MPPNGDRIGSESTLPAVAMPSAAGERAQRPRAYAELDAAMDRYARGEDDAFRKLHRGLSPRLRGFLLRLGGDAALAADLTQETFLRMHRARGSFVEGSAVVPWALAIARNAYLDHQRKLVARAQTPEADLADADGREAREVASASGDAEKQLMVKDAMHVVKDTLAKLPVSQREAFVLLRFEGLSVIDAAEVLGTTESAVKIRAFRAYEALRAALRAIEEGS